MWIVKGNRMLGVIIGCIVLGLALFLTGCGGSEETTSTSAVPTTTAPAETTTSAGGTATTAPSTPVTFTGDEALIADNWMTFFDGSLPITDKAGLLENGDQYSAQLEAQASNPLAAAATAKVTAVTITSDTTADVGYDLLVGGTPALPGQKGQAVLQDGVWKVSDASFEALLALQGAAGGAATTTP